MNQQPSSSETALATMQAGGLLAPMQQIEIIKQRYEAIAAVRRDLMKEGIHYGAIGLTGDKEKDKNKKPTLLKPGAEVLCAVFALEPDMSLEDKIEDWDNPTEPFFYYRYKFILRRADGRVAGVAEGSCNSKEVKYRYRGGGRVCPGCGGPYIRRSNYGSTPGWYCAERIGGCGANFGAEDQSITSQVAARTLNPDIPEQANTILKIAQKRGFISGTLMATMASEFFVPDLDDFLPEDDPGSPPPEPRNKGQQRAIQRGTQPAAGTKSQNQQQSPQGQQTASQAGKPPSKISDGQRRRFYAIAKESGRPDEVIQAYCRSMGFARSDDITVDKYEEMIRWAQDQGAWGDHPPARSSEPPPAAPNPPQGPQPIRRGGGSPSQDSMFPGGRPYPE